jgi:peptidoglycan/LPS O-acetylase OafA/YrhL
MDISNLIILSLAVTFVLYFVQRTERKRIWLSLLVLALPAGILIYNWAVYKDQRDVAIAAALIGLGLNVVYFVAYGRKHPPVAGEITVVGSDQ